MRDPNEKKEFIAEKLWQADTARNGVFGIIGNGFDDVDDATAKRYHMLAAAAMRADDLYRKCVVDIERTGSPDHVSEHHLSYPVRGPWQVTILNTDKGRAFIVREHSHPAIALDRSFWPDDHTPPVDIDGYFQPDGYSDVSPYMLDTARVIAQLSTSVDPQ